MKTTLASLLLALAAPLASAATPDYATQWPVQAPRADAGAYALMLTPEVYRAVQRADLRDLDVLDANGRPVPAEIVPPKGRRAVQRMPARWYAMPSPGEGAARDWRVIAELDADGHLRGLHSDGALTADASRTTLLIDTGERAARAAAPELVAIDLQWQAAAPFERGYRVEGSDDFDTWRTLGRGRLLDAQQDGRRLVRDRLPVDATTPLPRYLRVVPEAGDAPLPAIARVDLELARDAAATPAWFALQPRGGGRSFEFDLPGRFPVRWVDVDTGGNDARRWRLQSRDGDGDWIDRVDGWVVYRIGARRSPPQRFDAAIRDRHWRLVAQTDGDAPRLRVGYVPERLVFVGAGQAPYVVVAGSATARRASRPVLAALDGRDAPVEARLGPARARAGAAALQPPRDWKTWSLWGVLALGVLLVGAFAVRLLREPAPAVD